ncbi:NAD(P)/FAD-dependent oxidoreductase [Ruegeria sp.]|uniref:NAD(P)/FAD-dependent oxidoreductase n=1 Tax=Ruegeria sp. TaxID=1879320 RepID=UPI003B590140
MRDHDQSLWRITCREDAKSCSLSDGLTVDLAVIGGGFTGCSAALTASKAGASVCVLEAEQIGFGGSGRNVGLVNAGLWLPPAEICKHLGDADGERLISLLAAAPDEVFGLIEQHNIRCDPVRSGSLHCAHSPAGLRDLQTRHAQLVAKDAPVQLLSASEAAQRTGSAAFHGALFDPRAGTIQPLSYVRGLARAAVEAGARIVEHCPVVSMHHEDGVWTLKTGQGIVRAKALIQATNAYHRGLPDTATNYVPVYYFQFSTAPLPETLRSRILPGGEGGWDTGLIMTSFRLDAEGRLIIGAMGNLAQAGHSFHAGWIKRKLAELFPELVEQPLIEGWHGRIAMTSDHIPKITRIGPNALSAHGYSGRGIGPGTVFGGLMAESLLQDNPALLPVPAVDEHRESWTGLRQAFFETGAALTHFVKARF